MGGCFKKDFKDSVRRQNHRILQYETNLINMGLGNKKMTINDFEKLYTQMLEPYKMTAISMVNESTKNIEHYYKSEDKQKSNLIGLKTQIKKIQQEIKLLHMQLPIQMSNSIFIRQATSNQNFFKALISGSDNTPYANGLFLYDIFLPENYPTQCPKMQLITTGNNTIRFNPNLYANGYVCLSLLGTWRGDSVESWNPTNSNLLQVLLSIQSLVMSEGVYYNEPSHENDYQTKLGRQRNIGYSNIVRYATVKYAINQMIQQPPKGFEDNVKLHFAIKSNVIMKALDQWVQTAKKDNSDAAYDGLVSSHNYSLAADFKKNSSSYYNKLTTEVDIAKKLLEGLVQELVSKDSEIFLKQNLENNKQQQPEEEKQEEEEQKDNANTLNNNQEKIIQIENQEEENKQSLDNNQNLLAFNEQILEINENEEEEEEEEYNQSEKISVKASNCNQSQFKKEKSQNENYFEQFSF